MYIYIYYIKMNGMENLIAPFLKKKQQFKTF